MENEALCVSRLSDRYQVRPLTKADLPQLERLCRSNPQYYASIGAEVSRQHLLRDLTLTPPGLSPERKHFLGFFDGELIAVLDLLEDYPAPEVGYVGLFMVRADRSGRGVGTAIIGELCVRLAARGLRALRLAYKSDNPQAARFWRKNGFTPLYRADHEFGEMTVAERVLAQ